MEFEAQIEVLSLYSLSCKSCDNIRNASILLDTFLQVAKYTAIKQLYTAYMSHQFMTIEENFMAQNRIVCDDKHKTYLTQPSC